MRERGRVSASTGVVRLIVACVLAGASTAACTGSTPAGSAPAASPTWTGVPAEHCVVGAAWYQYWDGAVGQFVNDALLREIPAVYGSFSFLARQARGSDEDQVRNIDELVRNGANVLIMSPSPDGTDLPAVKRAIDAHIPVIVLNEPIAARSLFIGFDDVEAGRQAAKGLLAVKPKGRYAIVGASEATSSSDSIAAGIREGLQPAVDRGDVTIAATVSLPWDATAEQWVSTILDQSGGRVDAIVADRDGLAHQIETALGKVGRADEVSVGGVNRPGSGWEGLFALADGTQAVDVWENGELIAAATVKAALTVCRDPDIAKVPGSASVKWPGRDPMTAILLPPVTITKENLSEVIATSMYWRQLICNFPFDQSQLPACQLGPVPTASPST